MLVMDLETIPLVSLSEAEQFARDAGQTDLSAEAVIRYASTLPPLARIVCIGFVAKDRRVAIVDKSLFPSVDLTRCRVCGWPLKERAEDGCTVDGCSMRPLPKPVLPEWIQLPTDEGEVVERAFEILSHPACQPLVTFGGRQFDVPMIVTAAMRHKLTIPSHVQTIFSEYRFRPFYHVDVRETLTNFGATKGGMRAWAMGLGLGDPKANGDGADVYRLVQESRVVELANYCLSDCDTTARLYARCEECRRQPQAAEF